MMGMLMAQPTMAPAMSMVRLAMRSRSFISTVPIVTMLPPAQRPSVRLSRAELVSSQQRASIWSSSGSRKCTVKPMLSISSR